MHKGLIHIYYGDGKGKTTAAIGLGVRAAGSGMRVFFQQFLKTNDSSELRSLRQIKGFEIGDAPPILPFYFQMSEKEKEQYGRYAHTLLQRAEEGAEAGRFDVLILDELLGAVSVGIFTEERIADFLRRKPDGLEIVLTGHTVGRSLADLADYVSQVIARKHPYEKGVPARKGIEF